MRHPTKPAAITLPIARAMAAAALTLAWMTPAWAQSGYNAAELLPLVNGKAVIVKGIDADGRAIGMSNISRGIKYDLLTGFYVKYDYVGVQWPAGTKATRAVNLTVSTFEPAVVHTSGVMAGYLRGVLSPGHTVLDAQGVGTYRMENVGLLNAINRDGWVVGWTSIEPGRHLPALWRTGTLVRLQTNEYTSGEAIAINGKGQIVGKLWRHDAEGGYDRAVPVMWGPDGQLAWIGPAASPPPKDGQMRAYNPLTAAIGIDDQGTILFEVEEYRSNDYSRLSSQIRMPDGRILAPVTPDGFPMQLTGMNARGDAVGRKLDGKTAVPVIRKADGSVIDLAAWVQSGKLKLPSGAGKLSGCGSLNDVGMLMCETEVKGLFGSTYKKMRLIPY